MKKKNGRPFSRLLSIVIALALLVSAVPMAARAAVPSGGLVGGYFLSGDPAFAYVITGLDATSKNTVKLYQNEDMQSYDGYTGSYDIPERVYNNTDMRTYTVTEIGGAVGELPGALENVALRGLSLPDTISVIGSRAIANCLSLEEIVFPTSVLELADDAFLGTLPRKFTLNVTDTASLPNESSYTVRGRALPVPLPCRITDLLVAAPLTVTNYVDITGGAALAGGRISVQSGSTFILRGALSGAGMVEVANGGSLTLGEAPSAFTGTIRLLGAASKLTNSSSSPISVTDASGKTVVVKEGETRLGGQKDDPDDNSQIGTRPQITTNYGGSVTVQDNGKTVVITAFDGYQVQDVVINGLSMGSITRYEFQQAGSQNTVAVTFARGNAPEGPDGPNIDPVFLFSDVSPSASYAESVSFLVNNGIFKGVNKSSFAPDQKTTRAMMASLFKRMEIYGSAFKLESEFTPSLSDVLENAWYADDAFWAVGTGIIPDILGRFYPSRQVTREDVALCLYRYTHARGYDTVMDQARLHAYKDIQSLPPASQRAMAWAATNGYIKTKGGVLNPRGSVTRAEMAETLARYLRAY